MRNAGLTSEKIQDIRGDRIVHCSPDYVALTPKLVYKLTQVCDAAIKQADSSTAEIVNNEKFGQKHYMSLNQSVVDGSLVAGFGARFYAAFQAVLLQPDIADAPVAYSAGALQEDFDEPNFASVAKFIFYSALKGVRMQVKQLPEEIRWVSLKNQLLSF